MEQKALYVLAGFDPETEQKLANLQELLYEQGFTGLQTKNIPMHITMGAFPVTQETELVQKLVSLAQSTAAFPVNFQHIGIFTGAKVLFAAPDAGEPMLQLRKQFGDCDGWTPHTTLLMDDPTVIYKALPVVLQHFSAMQGKITCLHLYEFFPPRHIATVQLKG